MTLLHGKRPRGLEKEIAMFKLMSVLTLSFLFNAAGSAQTQMESTWCLRFAMVEKTDSGSENWGVWPEEANQWWQKDGKKKFREFCDSTLENADFVLAWQRKWLSKEVCDIPWEHPPDPIRYPDPSPVGIERPEPPPVAYPDYSPPVYTPPDYSPPVYTPPVFPPPISPPPDKGPTGITPPWPGTGGVTPNYLMAPGSSSGCYEVTEERVSVNVYRAPISADKLASAKPIAKKEGRGGKPGKGAFQGAMKALRKEAKKAGARNTRP